MLIAGVIGEVAKSTVIGILVGIASLFYGILESLANIFSDLTLIQLVSSETARTIYQRIGLIITLFMLLKLTISAIQMVVNPDLITDKEKGVGNILKRIIIALFLLGITPFIFEKAMELQKVVIESQAIPRIVTGDYMNIDNFGREFSATLFTQAIENETDRTVFLEELLFDDGETQNGNTYFKTDYSEGAQYINSIGSAFLCLIIGGFACWMFLMYTISLALRLVQLLFLQIIAPVPILSSISTKKDNALNTWIKQCVTTYLDVFMRMFIVYLVILIENIIMSGGVAPLPDTNFMTNGVGSTINMLSLTLNDKILFLDGEVTVSWIVKLLLMLGTLLFAKKAPELIEEMFPGLKTKASGDFGFGLKSRTDIPGPAKTLLGAGLGFAAQGIASGIARGANTSINNNIPFNRKKQDLLDSIKKDRETLRDGKASDADKKAARARLAKNRALLEMGNRKLRKHFYNNDEEFRKQEDQKQSVIGNALSGAITGSLGGLKTGAKGKGMLDIIKNSVVASSKAAQAHENWINAGGDSMGDRIVSQIQRQFGITTRAQAIERGLQLIENDKNAIARERQENDKELQNRESGVKHAKGALDGTSNYNKGKTVVTTEKDASGNIVTQSHNYAAQVSQVDTANDRLRETYKKLDTLGTESYNKTNSFGNLTEEQYDKLLPDEKKAYIVEQQRVASIEQQRQSIESLLYLAKRNASPDARGKIEGLIDKYVTNKDSVNEDVQTVMNNVITTVSQATNQSKADFADIMGVSAITSMFIRTQIEEINAIPVENRTSEQTARLTALQANLSAYPDDPSTEISYRELVADIGRNSGLYADCPETADLSRITDEIKSDGYASQEQLIQLKDAIKAIKKFQERRIAEGRVMQTKYDEDVKTLNIAKAELESKTRTFAAQADDKYGK